MMDKTLYIRKLKARSSSRLGMRKSNDGTAFEKQYELTNHLGNVMAVVSDTKNTDGTANILSATDYYPFGMQMPARTLQGEGYRYGFGSHEIDDEVKGDGNHISFEGYGYDPRTGRRWRLDPIDQIYISNYAAFANNPIIFIDPNGRSTHTDLDGNVLSVFDDDDLGVYQHGKNADGGIPTEYMLSKRQEKWGTSAGGKKMGETEFLDEFKNPETGKTLTDTKIQFEKSFDPIIERMHEKAKDMDLKEIALESRGGGLFDIKKDYLNVGGLLNGKYATSRSAGNFLAGYNAESGTYFGVGISFETFQQLAGALHIEESHGQTLSKVQMANIILTGTYMGGADIMTFIKTPTHGELPYQYRMSKIGWDYGKTK